MNTSDPAARDTLRLLLTRGVGPTRYKILVDHAGSPTAALNAAHTELAALPGIPPAIARRVISDDPDRNDAADRELEAIARLGVTMLTPGEPGYPYLLGEIPDPPAVLFVRGRLALTDTDDPHDHVAVAMVGSRKCSVYGIEQARRFAGAFARSGVTVVSGGARGIDGAAHEGTLIAGGRTIVVLGCGLQHNYPPEHAGLFDRIVTEDRGAIISELPTGSPPAAENFPKRNRIISGLSLGTLVVEANERSGALITTRVAVEDQGREAFAIPGRINDPTSAGTNGLIKSGGAHLVTDPADVLTHIAHAATLAMRPMRERSETRTSPGDPDSSTPAASNKLSKASGIPNTRRALLATIGSGSTFDEVLQAFDGPPAALQTELTMLELDGLVTRQGSLFVVN